MKIRVLLVQEFYQALGRHEIVVEVPEGARVRDLLARLPEPVRSSVLTPKGELKHPAMVSVNGRRIEFLQGLDTPLSDGDEVLVSPRALFVV